MDEELGRIRAWAAENLGAGGSHGMDHTERVYRLCSRIGLEEGAELGILLPAALLHDIARPLEKARGLPHEQEGARMAGEYLRSIGFDPGRISRITAAIRTHRFTSREQPGSLEARVLSDADKLDAMGAVGIARTFLRAGEHGGGIGDAVAHFHDKLLRLKDHMYTQTGRRIADERHALLVQFLSELQEDAGDMTD
jgi:uncharacterized protein